MPGPVRLSDVIVPEVFAKYMQVDTMTKTALWQSGIIRADAELATQLAGGGRTFNVPFWKDLTDNESDVGNDDPEDESVPDAIGTGKDITVRQVRTKSWSSMRLTSELAGSDPLKAIQSRVAAYWNRQFQAILVSVLRGIFAANVASNSGDMVRDISLDSAAAVTSAELVSSDAILDTRQTAGDASMQFNLLMMHSVVYTRLNKLNLIDFIPDSEGRIDFPRYLGYPVVVDDGCPAIAGTNRTSYHTYLVGAGAIGWAESPLPDAVETYRVPQAGRGVGMDQLYTRRQFALHPYGIKWTDTTVTNLFPTNAELRLAANWSRVYPERKQIPLALLVTNG